LQISVRDIVRLYAGVIRLHWDEITTRESKSVKKILLTRTAACFLLADPNRRVVFTLT